MEHGDAHALMSEHLDGELDPGRTAALEAHLAGCAACSAELERLRGAVAGLRRLGGGPEPASDLLPAVAAKLRRRSRGRYFGRGFTASRSRMPELIALVMLVLLVLLYVATSSMQVLAPGRGETSAPPSPREAAESDDPGR